MKLSRIEAIEEIDTELERVERFLEEAEEKEALSISAYWMGRKDALNWLKERI